MTDLLTLWLMGMPVAAIVIGFFSADVHDFPDVLGGHIVVAVFWPLVLPFLAGYLAGAKYHDL